MWKIYALLSAFFAALTVIFAKVGVSNIDSNLAAAIRTFFILGLTIAIVVATGVVRDIRTIEWSTWAVLFASAMATGLSWLFYFKALQLGEVSKVAPLDKLSVPLAMLFAFILLGEAVTLKTLLGGGLITVGALIMIL